MIVPGSLWNQELGYPNLPDNTIEKKREWSN